MDSSIEVRVEVEAPAPTGQPWPDRYAKTYHITPEFLENMGETNTRRHLAESLTTLVKSDYGVTADPSSAKFWKIDRRFPGGLADPW
jgi:hypothetical protein